jgi:hypothetical protein
MCESYLYQYCSIFQLRRNLRDGLEVSSSALKNRFLTFTLSDDDQGQEVRYRVQISRNSNFSQPAIDYRSAIASQGEYTFMVGTGAGTYAEGSKDTQFQTGNHYLRIRAEDALGAASAWTEFGSPSFKVLAEPTPTANPTQVVETPLTKEPAATKPEATDLLADAEVAETPLTPEPGATTPEAIETPITDEIVAFSPLDNPAGVADTAVTALALAAAAGAAGSRSRGGNSSSGGSQPDESDNDEGSISTIDVEVTGHDSAKLGAGDRLGIWALPILNFIDEPSHKAGVKSSKYSPLISKLIIDGAYLRAMLGSLALLGTFVAPVSYTHLTLPTID